MPPAPCGNMPRQPSIVLRELAPPSSADYSRSASTGRRNRRVTPAGQPREDLSPPRVSGLAASGPSRLCLWRPRPAPPDSLAPAVTRRQPVLRRRHHLHRRRRDAFWIEPIRIGQRPSWPDLFRPSMPCGSALTPTLPLQSAGEGGCRARSGNPLSRASEREREGPKAKLWEGEGLARRPSPLHP